MIKKTTVIVLTYNILKIYEFNQITQEVRFNYAKCANEMLSCAKGLLSLAPN